MFTDIFKAIAVLGILGFIFGVLLSIASKIFAVEMDPLVGNILGVYLEPTVEPVDFLAVKV